jgi:hypothetical protein
MFVEAADESERSGAVLQMADSESSATAVMGLQWAAVLAENEGDIADATRHARRAMDLADENTTPWQLATLHTHLATLAMQVGDHQSAIADAEAAWPLLNRLHAYDDARQVRAGMAMAALLEGDTDECEQILHEITRTRSGSTFGVQWIESAASAELALARGEVREGLRLYLGSVEEMGSLTFAGIEPSGMEPWTMVAEAAALTAHARHGRTADDAVVRDELGVATIDKVRCLLQEQIAHLDYPVAGMSFAALAQWLFVDEDSERQRAGIPLLAMADRFSYSRTFPVMAWAPLADAAERIDPGRLDALLREYDGRPGRELLSEALAALDGATSARSSG